MRVIETNLPGVVIIEPTVYRDNRGYFLETFQQKQFIHHAIPERFVQDNHSRSKQHVIRGLHYQLKHPQSKLVSVSRGEVLDVVVDVRLGAPTYGQWASWLLSDKNHRQIYIPAGFAHGFCVISQEADVHYKCDEFYTPGDEFGIVYNDSDLGILWPTTAPIISDKDLSLPRLCQQSPDKLPVFAGEPLTV